MKIMRIQKKDNGKKILKYFVIFETIFLLMVLGLMVFLLPVSSYVESLQRWIQ